MTDPVVPLLEMLIDRLGRVEDGVRELRDRDERRTPKLTDLRPVDPSTDREASERIIVGLISAAPFKRYWVHLDHKPHRETIEVLKNNGYRVYRGSSYPSSYVIDWSDKDRLSYFDRSQYTLV